MKDIAYFDKKITESFEAELAAIKSGYGQADIDTQKVKEYEDVFMAAHEQTARFEQEFKAFIISGYEGGHKFSQKLLSIVYDNAYSSLNEYCSSRFEMPKRFEEAMASYEMAFSEGARSVADRM